MSWYLKWAQVDRFCERIEPLLNPSIPTEVTPRASRVLTAVEQAFRCEVAVRDRETVSQPWR